MAAVSASPPTYSPTRSPTTTTTTTTTKSSTSRGGYDLQFAETLPSHLVCLICGFVAREPHEMSCCGKLYCKSCIQGLRATSSRQCPNCHRVGEPSRPSQKSDSLIRGLMVCCKNASRECRWLGKLEEIDSHLLECPKAPVKCMYSDIGCRVRLLRENQEQHSVESIESHFMCALDMTVKLRRAYSELKRELQRVKQEYQPRLPLVVFKMGGFEGHRSAGKCWYSPSFLSHRGGYKMCLRVDARGVSRSEGAHLSVFTCLMQGENDGALPWPFLGEVTVELLNQLKDAHHHKGVVKYERTEEDECNKRVTCVVSGTGRGWPLFVSHDALGYKQETECQYLKDNALFFRVARVEVYAANKPWLMCTC